MGVSFPNRNQELSRGLRLNPESFSYGRNIFHVVCHNGIGITVDGNIQDHVVIGVQG